MSSPDAVLDVLRGLGKLEERHIMGGLNVKLEASHWQWGFLTPATTWLTYMLIQVTLGGLLAQWLALDCAGCSEQDVYGEPAEPHGTLGDLPGRPGCRDEPDA